ncbi:HNH endonuclease signature motif containing protein [Actinoplanes regularis]|uniref:HNH endonuclease signature motif containing protein n=1 Tax=Actinoplanes regularis TaxID=52697 RepID=UPI0024A1BA2C|nr:HNH endonuclease signature motif containing protein [Actinoplanes regularis]GLW32243.1 hypothetical protein Areg01_51820 [Actinoplanes regularis]
MDQMILAGLNGHQRRTFNAFFAAIEPTSSISACWKWTGRLNPNGYGCFGPGLAHRRAYEMAVGQIPAGLVIDHLCRVRHCVNPLHMEPVTALENTQRGLLGGGWALRQRRKTHCPQGHPYDENNTYTHRIGRPNRRCRRCNTNQQALRRARLRNDDFFYQVRGDRCPTCGLKRWDAESLDAGEQICDCENPFDEELDRGEDGSRG